LGNYGIATFTDEQGMLMNGSPYYEDQSDKNDIEIIELDAQRPRSFSYIGALRRKAPFIWWAALVSGLLLLVFLVGPENISLLLESENHQISHIASAWATNHDVFLVADQTAIYVASTDNTLAALRTNNGRLLWHVPTNGPLSGKPVIAGGIVYASSATTIYAISASSGRLLWQQTPEESLLRGQPVVGEEIVSISLANGALAAWQASDGRLLWETSAKGEDMFPVAIADGMVYADTSGGAVVAVGDTTGVLLWKLSTLQFAPRLPTTESPIETSFELSRSTLTLTLSRVQTENGGLLWRHDFSSAAILQGGDIAIAEGGGLVYVSEQNRSTPGGTLTAVRASTGKPLWQCATGTGFVPPLVAGGVVYIGSQYGVMNARRADNGSLLWRYTPASLPLTVVTITDDTVYLGSAAGTVEAVRADTGTLRWRYDANGPISDITQDGQGGVLIGAGNGFIVGLQKETGTLLWQASSLV
jgi:eukaryotic-like serine/threonine-protein kinase